MNAVWTDPRFVWVAFAAGAVAMVMSSFLFAGIVWFVVGRQERRSDKRVKEAEAAAQSASRYATRVANEYGPVAKHLDEVIDAVNDHAERIGPKALRVHKRNGGG